MPRRDKVVNILAVRYVKQGTETARFRTDSTSHSCQYVCMYKPLDLISNRKYREATWNGKYGDRSHKLGNAVAFLVEWRYGHHIENNISKYNHRENFREF